MAAVFRGVSAISKSNTALFLEHRRIQPREDEREKVYEQAARKRRVLVVLPLDDRCVPVPPERGRIYATLPTEVTLPFGIHVNADWLLNISRMGLGEIEDAWQREIVDRIADVLARVLDWVSRARSAPDTHQGGVRRACVSVIGGGRHRSDSR